MRFRTLRPPFARIAPLVVPALAAMLAVGAVAGTAVLLAHAQAARDRQTALMTAQSALSEVEALPWTLAITGDGSQIIEARLSGDEARMRVELRRLGLQRAAPALERNFAVLGEIAAFARAHRADAAKALGLAADEQTTLARVTGIFSVAETASARSAKAFERAALVESSTVIAILLLGFGLAYVRAVRGAARQRQAHDELAVALAKLERIQQDRMRLLTQTVRGAEDERRRIANDLHDGPIQRLTATAFSVDLLANRLARGERDVSPLLGQIRTSLVGEMQSLRNLMTELRPPLLDERGVGAAITDAAARILSPSTECRLEDRIRAARLSDAVETAAHRVAQEALVNIEKHAHASHVSVRIERTGDSLLVSIADDGVGFDEDDVLSRPAGEHLGLLAMRERLESLGGELQLVSCPGSGTRVEASLPWSLREEEERRAVA